VGASGWASTAPSRSKPAMSNSRRVRETSSSSPPPRRTSSEIPEPARPTSCASTPTPRS